MADDGVQTVQQQEYDAAVSGGIPASFDVADGVWTIPVEFPTQGQGLRYTLCYALADAAGGVHLIDPGMHTDDNWRTLGESLRQHDRSIADVRTVIVTHLHFDHLGMAERLQREAGAQLILHRFEQAAIDGDFGGADLSRFDRWGVPDEHRAELAHVTLERFTRAQVTADILVDGGDVLQLGDLELEVIWTPGHTYGHICLRDAARKLIFTGDHVLPLINPGLGLGGPSPSNPVDGYLASLQKVQGFDDHEVCPGHAFRFRGLAARCTKLAGHHERRTQEVAVALDETPDPSVWTVASRLRWSLGWQNLRSYLLDSALAQTEMHIDRLGRSDELGDGRASA